MNSSFRPINWNSLRTFYEVCQYSSLTEATKHLGLTQSCLSRRLAKLENSLGYRVLNRQGPQGIKLLKEGRELRDLISPFYQNLAEYDARHQLHGFTFFTTGKEQPSSRLPLSYTTEATTPLSMHPQKTQVNSMALSKVVTTVALLSSLFVQACQDVCGDKAQGLHFHEDPLIEKSDLTPTQQIKAYKEDLEKKLHQALVAPTPEHVKAYMMAEKQGRDQAQRFSDAWIQVISTNPELSRFESSKGCQQGKTNRPDQDQAAGHYTPRSVFVRSPTRGIELLNVTPPARKNCRNKNHFFEEAMKDIETVLVSPRLSNIVKANALFHRGDLNYDLGHFKKAIADFDAVLLIPKITDEIKSKTLHNRGVVKGTLGDHQGAIQDFKAALEVSGINEDTKANALFNGAVGRSNLKNLHLSLTERFKYIILEQTRESYDDQQIMLDSVFRKAQVSKGERRDFSYEGKDFGHLVLRKKNRCLL